MKTHKIILNHEGVIVSSTGTILHPGAIIQQSAIQLFPFIDSIFEALQQLKSSDEPLEFSAVNISESPLLPEGYYDYIFTYKDGIEWTIIDQTEWYRQKRLGQQAQYDQLFLDN